jgi:uncharacterized SAM-binding protein YcdF (DUF218 family)
MFFILSKILLFVLNPFYWIVLLALIAYKTKNKLYKKRWWLATGIIFFLFSNYRIYSWCVLAWQPTAKPIVHERQYSVGIILGGMTAADKAGNLFFRPGADRFLQTCKLYHTGIIKKILISGGDGSLLQNKPKEAFFLYNEFLQQNIPDTALILEPFSRNTYESAVADKQILDSLHIKDSCLLITSALHMKRSLATFTKAGIKVAAHPSCFEVVNSTITWYNYFIPDIWVLTEWKYLLKEIVGLQVYRLTGKA